MALLSLAIPILEHMQVLQYTTLWLVNLIIIVMNLIIPLLYTNVNMFGVANIKILFIGAMRYAMLRVHRLGLYPVTLNPGLYVEYACSYTGNRVSECQSIPKGILGNDTCNPKCTMQL